MCCDSPNLGLVVPTMALGGHGTANMGGNIAPAEMAAISKPWADDGDAEAFRAQYLALLPLLHFNYSAINPVAITSLMRACGLPVGSTEGRSVGKAGVSTCRSWWAQYDSKKKLNRINKRRYDETNN